jgi:hypothetical protein
VDLPLRIDPALPSEPVVSVDGAWGAPGLNLSHWPGHRTPRELRHDLSTGSVLAFGRLERARRDELSAGCVALVNNHYDTDGTCALFAARRPDEALPRADALLAAAACGDLYQVPNLDALALDAIVAGLADPVHSPLAASFAGASDERRYTAATVHLVEHLPALLDGEREPYRALFEPALEAWSAESADLEAAERVELVHLDWTLWNLRAGARAPGRHALFGNTNADRALAALPKDGGTLYRFVVNTTSWFDLVTRTAQPRPDLDALVTRLNELEGTSVVDGHAWRTQPVTNAAPELWFGRAGQDLFAEHNPALEPSALPPADVRRAIADALRATLALP